MTALQYGNDSSDEEECDRYNIRGDATFGIRFPVSILLSHPSSANIVPLLV